MLNKVKLGLLITGNDFDGELTDFINAWLIDMGIAGVETDALIFETTDAALISACVTYCGYRFETQHGDLNRANAFKKSYDEQKAQLSMASGYTVWSREA